MKKSRRTLREQVKALRVRLARAKEKQRLAEAEQRRVKQRRWAELDARIADLELKSEQMGTQGRTQRGDKIGGGE